MPLLCILFFTLFFTEAIAASLYIAGFKEEAVQLLAPFSYGEEFIKLNRDALEVYSQSQSTEEVLYYHQQYMDMVTNKAKSKEQRKDDELQSKIALHSTDTAGHTVSKGVGYGSSYLDDSDLPPMTNEEVDYGGGDDNYNDDSDVVVDKFGNLVLDSESPRSQREEKEDGNEN